MQINYSFSLNGVTVHPIYGDDFTLDYEKEADEQFFRKILNGSFSFVGEDYDYINSQVIDTEFWLKVNINSDPIVYAQGKFYKTDCKINQDDKRIDVDIQAKDSYDEVLSGINNLYDTAKLEVARTRLYLDKRPLIQTYLPNDNTVGCFLSGNAWEQDVIQPVADPTIYNFTLNQTFYRISVTGTGTPTDIVGDYTAKVATPLTGDGYIAQERTGEEYSVTPTSIDKDSNDLGAIYIDDNGKKWKLREIAGSTYYFHQFLHSSPLPSSGTLVYSENGANTTDITYNISALLPQPYYYYTLEESGIDVLFYSKSDYLSPPFDVDILFLAYQASGLSSGVVSGFKQKIDIYARYLTDLQKYGGTPTTPIPVDDLVENNRNYNYSIGYGFTDSFHITSNRSDTPTVYGIADDGKYFLPPGGFVFQPYPISRSNWALSSLWFTFSVVYDLSEPEGRKAFLSRENMLLSDVIKILLSDIDPNLTHDGTPEYSEILYSDSNPLSGGNSRKMINQKSNVMAGELDEPARKEEIRLSSIMEMLKGYECYWFIDDQDRFRIEHISWFKNGGSYSSSPIIGADLTTLVDSRNKKPLAFSTSKFEYDKQSMPERYEFQWMDDVTNSFKGYPIIINSNYVERGDIKQISLSSFTSDVDYVLLNPSNISLDGFVLFDAIFDNVNLFNINDSGNVLGHSVDHTSGTIYEDINRNVSDFIEIRPELEYSFSSIYELAWFDGDKNFISGTYNGDFPPSYLSSPPGSLYVRVSQSLGSDWNNFKLVLGIDINGTYRIPYASTTVDGYDLTIQNYLASWIFIHPTYWPYDLPSRNFNMNSGQLVLSQGIKRSKVQTVNYPSTEDPSTTQLIKTYLGDGDIEKISVNLSSRDNEIELRYDTE